MAFEREECWTLVGRRRGKVWLARRVGHTKGERARVEFNGPWALEREEKRGDVIGFLHTHPPGFTQPSQRDVRTMRAWCGAFGKPLICLISSGGHLGGFRFDDDESGGVALAAVEVFPRGVVIGVDGDGGEAASRGTVSRGGKNRETEGPAAGALRRGRARVEPGR